MHLNWRHLRNPQQWERIEIGFEDAAAFDRDFLLQRLGKPVENGALRHVICRRWVDNMAADVADSPYFIDLYRAVGRHGRFHNLSEIAEMAVVVGDAKASPLRELAASPTGNLAHFFQDAASASRVETQTSSGQQFVSAQQIDLEL